MRISSLQQFNLGLYGMLDNQSSLQYTYQQITTGRKVVTPADDPVAATKILQVEQELALNEKFNSNVDASINRLGLEENTLRSITDQYLMRARQLAVQAGNGSMTKEDREVIAVEIDQILAAVADLMNSRDASNEYIFSGNKGDTPAFVLEPNGDYAYQGDEGQRELFIGKSTRVATTDNGKKLFVDVNSAEKTFYTETSAANIGRGIVSAGLVIDQQTYDDFYPEDIVVTFNPESAVEPPSPNYTLRQKSDGRVIEGISNQRYVYGAAIEVSGLSFTLSGNMASGDQFFIHSSEKQALTTTLKRFSDGLKTFEDTPEGGAQVKSLVSTTLDNLDNAIASISEVISEVGSRNLTLDSTKNLIQDVSIVNQEILSKTRDVDFTEAISRLEMETFLLEASQRSYAKISNLSLFNRL
jgi:flagellar hook-associated protein 3 FlgL